MSAVQTWESERLCNAKKENDNVALEDINEDNTASISGETWQKQPTMDELLTEKYSLSETDEEDFFDDVENLRKKYEEYGSDDSYLQEKLPHIIRYTPLNESEYVLNVYDKQEELSEELKEKVKEAINDQIGKAAGVPTFLQRISNYRSAVKVMKILQKHPELFQPVLNLTYLGRTPLLNACERRNEEVAKCLVQCGADVSIKDENGKTALYYAAKNNLADVVEEIFVMRQGISKGKLLKDSDVYGEGHSIFFLALRCGSIKLCDFLLTQESGGEILKTEIGHKDFQKAMCYLCEVGCNEIIEHLLRIDQSILSITDEVGATPLLWAARKNQLDTVKLILFHNKELINVFDNSGRGVVYYCSPYSRILEYLLSEFSECQVQAKVVDKPKEGFPSTALEQAAFKDYRESALILLHHGAHELFSKEYACEGYNFFENVQLMQMRTLQAILNFLEKNVGDYWRRHLERTNRDFYTPLLTVALNGRVDLVNLLLDKGADALKTNYEMRETPSALHCAVESGSLSTVECLVRRRPELCDMQNYHGDTVLEFAIEKNKPDMVRCLLACGASRGNDDSILCQQVFYGDNNHEVVFEIVSGRQKEDLKKDMEKIGGVARVMQNLVKMYPKATIELLDKCFENVGRLSFRHGDENSEYFYYDFVFLMSHGEGSKAIDTMVKFKRDECLAHPVVEKFIELKWNSATMKKFYYTNLLVYSIFLICLTTHIVMQANDPANAAKLGLQVTSIIALIINSFNLIKEIFQIKIIKPFKRYLYDVANFVEWIMYISSVVYFVPLSDKNHVQIGAGAIAVFLAWVNFTLFLQMFSPLGIYIIMAKKVFTSILKVMPIILLFIVAFGVSFLALMTNDEGFKSFPVSILTTFVMVTGEIDYRDVFLKNETTPNQVLQRLFLVLIVVTCGIVLMNFLVGLAVDDTSKIMERSKAEERLQKATAIKALETSLYSVYLRPPVTENPYFEKKRYKFSEKVVNAKDIKKQDDERTSTLSIDDVARRLDTRIDDVTQRLDNIRRLVEKVTLK